MSTILQIHLGFAFFVFLLGLFIGWVQLGRRVVVTVLGIQILIGVILAAWAGAGRIPLPGTLWIHIVGAVLALFAYIVARRVADRAADYRPIALILSFFGLVLIIFTAWYGTQLFRTAGI